MLSLNRNAPAQAIRAVLLSVLVFGGLVAGTASAEPALWHISGENSDVYLFGTVHILPPELSWRTERIERAFESADTIWFEAPANDPAAQIEMLGLVQQLGLNPAGTSLSEQISVEARNALNDFSAEIGIPLAGLEPLRPWLASVTLTAAYVQSQGYAADSGVEARLWPLANERGKALRYFETLDEQLHFFADLPPEVEVALFEQTVMEYRNASDQLDSLVSAWQNADIAQIDRLINGEMRQTAPEVYEVVIASRNEAWVDRIQTLLDGSGSHFVALGAGHLAGEEGLIERLRAKGVEISGP